jgi:hypothetical protein
VNISAQHSVGDLCGGLPVGDLTLDEIDQLFVSVPVTPRQTNTPEAVAFLRKWPSAFPHLVAIHVDPMTNKKGLVEGQSFPRRNSLDANGPVERYVDKRQRKANQYFTVNSLLAPMTSKPAKENVDEVIALQIDADVPAGEDQDAGAAKLIATIRSFRLTPSVIISSGGGVQAFWFLHDRIKIGGDILKAEAAECYGRGLEDEFRAMGAKVDSCHNIDRIMRLPFTENIPDLKKIGKGRKRALATLVQFTDVTYPLSAFTPAAPKPSTGSGPGSTPFTRAGNYELIEPDDPRLAPLGEKWKQMGPDGERYRDYGDDRSRAVMAFAMACAGSGIDDLVIASCLMTWEIGQHIRDQPNVPRALARTLMRAKQRIANRASALGFNDESETYNPPTQDQQQAIDERERARLAREAAPDTAEIDNAIKADEKPKHIRHASPVIAFDEVALTPRPWILTNLACRGLVSIVTGLSGASKSTYGFPLALAAITGRDDIAGFHVRERTRVWMWNQEDDLPEMQRRLLAAMRTFNVSWEDTVDENGEPMLYMDSGVEAPLMLAVKQDKAIRGTPDVAAVIDTVRERKIGLLMLDPLVEFHEADENANMEMRAVIGCVRSITAGTGCAGVVVAHTGKPPNGSSKGFAGNPNAIRGAYAQVGTARIVATVYAAAKEDEKEWILPGGVENYVRVDIAKNNIGPRPTVWLKREMQTIGGEPVAMVRPAPVQRKVKEGKPDMLAGFARVLAMMNAFGQPTPLASLLEQVSELTPEDKAALSNFRTRTRWLEAAFGGKAVNEWLTDSGLLVRSAGKGKVGTLLTLAPPANSSETQDAAA